MTWSWIGNTYQFVEQEDPTPPERPRCGCGCFLAWQPVLIDYIYGYPGGEITEKRWARWCKKCKSWSYDD